MLKFKSGTSCRWNMCFHTQLWSFSKHTGGDAIAMFLSGLQSSNCASLVGFPLSKCLILSFGLMLPSTGWCRGLYGRVLRTSVLEPCTLLWSIFPRWSCRLLTLCNHPVYLLEGFTLPVPFLCNSSILLCIFLFILSTVCFSFPCPFSLQPDFQLQLFPILSSHLYAEHHQHWLRRQWRKLCGHGKFLQKPFLLYTHPCLFIHFAPDQQGCLQRPFPFPFKFTHVRTLLRRVAHMSVLPLLCTISCI